VSAPESVAIVGGSLAGVRCASQLRRSGFAGPLTIIHGESGPPYDRPPLSKQYLAGEWEVDRFELLPDDKLPDLEASWRVDTRAVSLDVGASSIELDSGEVVTAETIVIATGASPRRLPGTEGLTGVHVLRTRYDARVLRDELSSGPKKVVVIGAGFIGAEVAATAAGRGHDVTIVEAAPVPMERGLGHDMGLLCGGLHAEHGVDLRLSTSVTDIRASDGRISEVRLNSGEELPADVLIVGIGVQPNTGWLDDSGLAIENGVVCTAWCEAGPGVYAAGDVARWFNERFGELMRVEHWENAVEQGSYVAKRIMGESKPFAPVPWFWSDQYDHKIQLAGRPAAGDTIEIVTGTTEERRFAAIYGQGDKLTGVFGLNRPRHVMQYRRLIADGASWTDALEFAEAARLKTI
jgi:3-phenylpropionate/trans-cinnamate dioxygenase ferredoxin reductase subunit